MTVTTLPAGTTTYTAHTTVAAADTLRFPPNSSATLVMNNRNLIIEGRLEMKPSGPNIVHLLQFTNVNEANFVGGAIGGMGAPLDTDVGLWVMNNGVLDAIGSPKVGWNRTGNDTTWATTDEMYKTPWAVGDFSTYAVHAKGGALQTVLAPDGSTQTQEAFNLTRNVRIEGTPGHNTHIFIRTDVAQTIKYVQLRHVGPRTPAGGGAISNIVRGRWGMHLHHLGDAGYDTLIEGCVVRDNPSHAFVAHGSHGVTFRDCVAFNVSDDCYWWDVDVTADQSFDVVYDHCMASKLIPIPAFRGYLLTGFVASHGSGTMTDCVATGNLGNVIAPGFQWPADANFLANAHGLWANSGNVSHNNNRFGLYFWQNDAKPHHIEYFTAFRNGAHGILAGAYVNVVRYDHLLLFQNPGGDLVINAGTIVQQGVASQQLSFKQAYTDELLFKEHSFGGVEISRLDDSTFNHATINETPLPNAPDIDPESHYDFVNTDLEPSDWDVQYIGPNSFYRIQRANGTAYQITDAGIEVIAAFAGVGPFGTGGIAASKPALSGVGTETGIGLGAFKPPKPALVGTGTHATTTSGIGAFAALKPALAGTGTGTAQPEGHVEALPASLEGTGHVQAAPDGSPGSAPIRLRSLRRAGRVRGITAAHVRGDGGSPTRAALRVRSLTGGSTLRGRVFPSSVRSGSGIVAITATGAFEASAAVLAATGASGEVVGAGTVTLAAAALAGTGTETITGTGDLTAAAAILAGTGTESNESFGNFGAGAAVLAATGEVGVTGAGGIAVGAASFAGAATQTNTGTGDIAAAPAAFAGVGSEQLTADGAFAGLAAALSGTGEFVQVLGAGSFVGLAPALSGTAVSAEITGEAVFEAMPASLSGNWQITGTGTFVALAAQFGGLGSGGPDAPMIFLLGLHRPTVARRGLHKPVVVKAGNV